MPKVYLDSSAIVKRYVLEPGSSAVDLVFDRCWVGELSIATSVWNIGVFDVRRRGWLGEDEFREAVGSFTGEVVRLFRLRALEVLPVLTSMLVESCPLILREHVYEADALQIRACARSGSDLLLSADRKLVEAASREGIRAVNVEDEGEVERSLREL